MIKRLQTNHQLFKQKFLLSLFLYLFISFSPNASAYSEAWEIDRFHSELTVEPDGDLQVQESIDADFTNEAHRGLERQIPFDYIGGYNTRLEFLGTEGDWQTTTFEDNGYFILQMTTPDFSQIKNPTTFNYSYLLKNAVLDQKEYQEIYWNVNGTDWPVKTKQVSGTIDLQIKNLPTNLELICFTGDYGSQEQNCQISQTENKITFTTTQPLSEYQGLTIGLKLPPNTVDLPSTAEKTLWFILDHPLILIPFIAFIVMLSLYLKYGRDEKTLNDTVIPHYTPPKNLLPGETGTIIDEKLDPQDITATIIHYAIKSYIQIKELPKKDYELTLIKPYENLKTYEEIILQALFPTNTIGATIKISALKNKFFKQLSEIDKAIMNQLVNDGYFPSSPTKTRSKYIGIGGTILFLSIYLIQIFWAYGLSGIVTGLIIIIFGYFMPRKTQKGKETYYELKGLYEYINTAEKDRIKFQEDHGILFEKLLPYAISFKLAKKWAKAFEGILTDSPHWYYPLTNNHFNLIHFGNAINSFNNNLIQNLTSQPGGRGGSGSWSSGSSFGGGGFSGGGFGGGGGRGL